MEPFLAAFRSYYGQTPLPPGDNTQAREKYLAEFISEYSGPALPSGLHPSYLLAFLLLRLEESRHGPRDTLGISRETFIEYAPAQFDHVRLGELYDLVAAAARVVPPTRKNERPMSYATGCGLL